MHKKLMLACMAIAAFAAFVVAPAASASPVLTDITKVGEPAETVPTSAWIVGKNTGNTLFEGGFAVTCTTAVLNGKVTANTGSTIAGEVAAGAATFTGTGSGGDCTSALGDVKPTVNSKLCLHAQSGSDNVTVTGCGANITFTLSVTGSISCAYSAASVTGTYQTSGDATVNLNKQPATRESGQSFLCPATGSLTMDFDLYTTDGTTIFIS